MCTDKLYLIVNMECYVSCVCVCVCVCTGSRVLQFCHPCTKSMEASASPLLVGARMVLLVRTNCEYHYLKCIMNIVITLGDLSQWEDGLGQRSHLF